MKIILAAAALAWLAPTMACAQTAPAPAATPAAAPAPAAKFSVDTPIEQLVADPQAKAVLEKDGLPGVDQHPQYDSFRSMSLRAVQPYSNGVITDEMLAKLEADLTKIK